ncbi:MAG: hypothetical protein ACR2O4_01845 [Hyphomicrobiaceae bacterium]
MSKNFHEPYQEAEVAPPKPRATGIVFTVVALVVALVFRANPVVLGASLGLAVMLGGLSWLAPDTLEPLNRVWFRFGMLLHKVVNPVVMALMFLVAIVPMGLLMQLRRDPLRKKSLPEGASYWIEVEQDETPESSMVNQF